MDSKTLRLTILFSTAALALILLVVYAANLGNRRSGRSGEAKTAEEQTDPDGTGAVPGAEDLYLKSVGDNFRAYGEQIGNQPRAFLYDESFFDPMRDVAEGIREDGEEELELRATVMEDTIHVSILNTRGGLETGVAFQVLAEQVATGKEKTWTDTDRDGQLDLTAQRNGNYRLYLLQVQGYKVPSAAVAVKVDAAVRDPGDASSAAGGTGDASEAGTNGELPGAGSSIASTGSSQDNAMNGSSSYPPDAGTGASFVIPAPGEAGGAMGMNGN